MADAMATGAVITGRRTFDHGGPWQATTTPDGLPAAPGNV